MLKIYYERFISPLQANANIYRVGQIKWGQLTFLLVTSERSYKIK